MMDEEKGGKKREESDVSKHRQQDVSLLPSGDSPIVPASGRRCSGGLGPELRMLIS
jgi:hypothetical protein